MYWVPCHCYYQQALCCQSPMYSTDQRVMQHLNLPPNYVHHLPMMDSSVTNDNHLQRQHYFGQNNYYENNERLALENANAPVQSTEDRDEHSAHWSTPKLTDYAKQFDSWAK